MDAHMRAFASGRTVAEMMIHSSST
jgi:hypothetical protein